MHDKFIHVKNVNGLGFSEEGEVLMGYNIYKVLNPTSQHFLADTTVSIFVRLCAESMHLAYCNPAFFIEGFLPKVRHSNTSLMQQSIEQKRDLFKTPSHSLRKWVLPKGMELKSRTGLLFLLSERMHHYLIRVSWGTLVHNSSVECELYVYDSILTHSLDDEHESRIKLMVGFLLATLLQIDVTWKPIIFVHVPQQLDGYSCGWRTCLNAFLLSRDLPFGSISFNRSTSWVTQLIATGLISQSLNNFPTSPSQELNPDITWDFGLINTDILSSQGYSLYQKTAKQLIRNHIITSEEKLKENKLKEQKHKEHKLKEQMHEEHKLKEQKLKEQKLKEQKLKEQKLKEKKLNEQKLNEQKLNEQKLNEQKLNEQKLKKQNVNEHEHGSVYNVPYTNLTLGQTIQQQYLRYLNK